MLRDILNDGFYALFNKICYFGAKTLAIVLITQKLGLQHGGSFIFLIGVVEILRVVSDFGIDIYVIRKYSEINYKIKLLRIVFYQKLISGCLLSLLLILYCFIFNYKSSVYIPVAMSLVFSLLFNLANSYYQSLNLNRKLSPAILIALIITSMMFLLTYVNDVAFEASYYLLVEFFFVSSVFLILIKKVGLKLLISIKGFSLKNIPDLYSKTASIGVNAIIVIVYSRLDNIYLKNFDPNSLASYGQVFRLIDPLVMVSSVFSTVAYAKFSKLNLREKGGIKKTIPFLVLILFYVLLSSFVYYMLILCFGGIIILHTTYLDSMIAGFLCIAGIKCMNGALTAILQSQGLYRISLYIAVLCITIAVPLMYVLINIYDAIGAIYSIVIVELVSFILLTFSVFLTLNKVKINLKR
ncbi:hypothetical protein [Xenorhabdus bovienii]|uniref:Wzx n=1 Tax=Xenorhabdus bovienii str. Intermedium TaxID=1379677 RepID=A0A077QLE6_XENBV|nr:hypothetical protein [Xenorhabdus bovienii]MDE9441517.1 hypothetical protein [Xenorhabdus bovienii]MDE9539934.1 hypothetical protein [Xenorhabdus bovienii]CDH34424.1 Wzx [Xenorhabdus bovienii str. Intermedium]